MRKVIIFGGAGFVGSAVARLFSENQYEVTVVDGLMAGTGGQMRNLTDVPCKVLKSRIEDIPDLSELLQLNDIVVDAMAWTSHLDAFNNPEYDIELNLCSHVKLITALRESISAKIIYLASSGQYGRQNSGAITETTPMIPEDVQGIDKTAADSYYRVYAKRRKMPVISLRFPNCYGEGQKTQGSDIGMIGGFIKAALENKSIELFGRNRRRDIVYVRDVAQAVLRLAEMPATPGYTAYNLAGQNVEIERIVQVITGFLGTDYIIKDMPEHISAIERGNAGLCGSLLTSVIGEIAYSDIEQNMHKTINYFREDYRYDLEM